MIPQIQREYQEYDEQRNRLARIGLWVSLCSLTGVLIASAYLVGVHYTAHQISVGEMGVACRK